MVSKQTIKYLGVMIDAHLLIDAYTALAKMLRILRD